jgi:hypothetical protein
VRVAAIQRSIQHYPQVWMRRGGERSPRVGPRGPVAATPTVL